MKVFMAPLRIFQAMGLTPAAVTRIRIWPSPAWGSSHSSYFSLSGPPYSCSTTAFIAAPRKRWMRFDDERVRRDEPLYRLFKRSAISRLRPQTLAGFVQCCERPMLQLLVSNCRTLWRGYIQKKVL